MKRVLSVLLCLALLVSVFSFSIVNTVSAEAVTAPETEWQEVVAEDRIPFNISFLKGFDWCLTSGGEGESNYMDLVKRTVVDSEQVLSAQVGASWSGAYEFSSITGDTVLTANNWEAPNFGTRWSNVEMNTSSNSVIVYVEIPDYEKVEATWGLGIGHIILDQNGISYDVELWSADDSREYYYLPVNGDSWQSGTVSIGGAFAGLPSGFKGYIRVDFNNFSIRKNGNNSLDITKDYKLNKFSFTMNAIGNECGNVLLGALFYIPENDDGTTSMSYQGTKYQLINSKSDELIIKPYNIFNNTQHSINTTPIVADVANKAEGFASPSLWALDGVKISSISGETVSTTDYREMYVPQWTNIRMQPDVDTFMLYVELPKFETAPALYMYYPQLTQPNMAGAWINPAGGEYKYLSEGGTEWKSGVIGTYGQIVDLYSGFKGYVKFDLKTFAGYSSIKEENKIDFNRVYSIATLQIGYNHVGGDNPLYLGGVYSVLEDCDTNYFTNATTGEVACATVISGDLDQSGEVDSSDLVMGRKIALGIVSPHTSVWRRSDIRGTGDAFDIRDLVFLKKKLLGIYLDNTFTIAPATAEYDSRLANNPDRGFRLEAYVNTSATKNVDINVKQWNSRFEVAANDVKDGIWQKPKLVQVYFYLTDYKDTETLPQIVFDNIQTVFNSVRNQGQRAVVRFAYQGDIPEYENQASQEIMFKHMQQLAPILEKNKAAICALEAGFLGAWGEWHAYIEDYYSIANKVSDEYEKIRVVWSATTAFDEIEIIKHILDMVPEEIPVQLRTSVYRDLFLEAYPNQGYETRLGLKNDAFFGYKNTNHASPYNSMTSVATTSAHNASLLAPMGGEFFWGCQWEYDRVTAEEAILMYKHFHQSFFSIYHNSFEGTEAVAGTGENAAWFATDREGDMSIWAREAVDTAWLDENKIFYSPSWLVDKNGNSVGRTKYEFVRDHLGYRLEAKNIHIKGTVMKNNTLDLSLDLQNYGFAPAFNLKGEFVLLDSNNRIVSKVAAGNPAEWHNAAADGSENTVRTHKISAKLTLPAISGSYKIAYRVYNTANDKVAFANSIDYVNGCNILYNINI